ncbi:threonine/serine exporter family protein [Acidisoma cellulosilytica]|uniref:Threonine/serine exporter family protein n=1 Tax=Acidisoma cellulosilyticum TaxID=2802395 RepID=A0A964E2X2_9PROT|nr:threonine/serine exporter family protein [Acidisoma cellulosilyticum]MCB8879677.1 threonine/serine exporter family protein [Acidisoma cellulosilyticum]
MAQQTEAGSAEAAAHCLLQFGRILLQNGADTGRVQLAVRRFATALGYEARLLIAYEGLILTLVSGQRFTTKIGSRIPAMNVGMSQAAAAFQVLHAVQAGRSDLAQAIAQLDRLEQAPPVYNRYLVAIALGMTAAALSRLFGGDWVSVAVCWVATAIGTWARQEFGKRGLSPVLVSFLTAVVSGVLGGLGARLFGSSTAALCLIAPGMVIVPGVPLINGVEDMLRNHADIGIARLGFSVCVIAAIGLGLEVASLVSGVGLPLELASGSVPLPEDAVFAALAALGFVLLFSVPLRLAWACAVCGLASHTVRLAVMQTTGANIVLGTLVGALLAGGLAQIFARRLNAPAATFAFPGVVAMVPGIYAFRTMAGAMQIVAAGTVPPAGLVDATVSLAVTLLMITGAIAIGMAVPLAIANPRLPARD